MRRSGAALRTGTAAGGAAARAAAGRVVSLTGMSRPPTLHLPGSARAHRLETPRGSFAVLDAGRPVRGTALLVPGYTGSKEDFAGLLGPLADAGWRVVAVDGRGQYESGGPRELAAYERGELVADLMAQARTLAADAPVHLLGHSMGGLLARAAVLDGGDPQAWASLTLMSTGPAAVEEAQRVRTRMLIDALAVMDLEAIWQVMQSLDTGEVLDTPRGDEAIDGFLHQRWLANVPEQLIATGRQLASEPDRVAELAAVPPRKLVVSGEVDDAWPVPWQADMAARLGVRHVVIPGAAHSPNAENPQATAAVLDAFWGSAG